VPTAKSTTRTTRKRAPKPTAAMRKTLARADGSEKCPRGHVLDAGNVIVWRSAPEHLRCKECYKLKRAEQAARRKARKAVKA
jgi:phage FluMu protein Com